FDDCKHHAVAKWTVSNMNNDPLDTEKALIVVTEVPLVDDTGAPVKDADEKPIDGADGKPRVKQFAACAPLKGTDRETCRSLFIDVSSCKIDPPDGDADAKNCIAEKVTGWVSDHPDEGQKNVVVPAAAAMKASGGPVAGACQ